MKKSKFISKSADSVLVGDRIQVYGGFMEVKQIRRVNLHPIQLVEIYIVDLSHCIRVPAGWQIKVEKDRIIP